MKRMLIASVAAVAAAAALVTPSNASAAEMGNPVCGNMKPVDCVVYYLVYWDPCLLCGGEDAATKPE